MIRIDGFPSGGRVLVALVWLEAAASGQLLPDLAPDPPVFDPPGQRRELGEPEIKVAADGCPDCGNVFCRPGPHRWGPPGRLRNLLPDGSGLHPPGRHRGLGRPLQQESWLYRPLSAGWFLGGTWEGEESGAFGGYRFGWDRSDYWGAEMRFAMGSTPGRDTLFHWDVDLLYYPSGDSAWRPYLLFGLGFAHVGLLDAQGERVREEVFAMVPAAGLKFRCNRWLALRLEIADNIAFGEPGRFGEFHSVSLTGGLEVRFGGSRRAYWPWHPGRHYW